MLTLLKIKNIALIDDLTIEFGTGLNLLTGETGSGKSIIVDSLGALTGDRVSSDLIKEGSRSAVIEGLFSGEMSQELLILLKASGIETDPGGELIVRRELSSTGKNRVFVNDQLVTQALLRQIGKHLVAINGQGEQSAIYDIATHGDLLDAFADVGGIKSKVTEAFNRWFAARAELASLKSDEAEKLRLLDILRFQTDEIKKAALSEGEDLELEEEKRRLGNVEKLTSLSDDAYALLYDNAESTASTLEKAQRKVGELTAFESKFEEYAEGIASARAVVEDLSMTIRDFRTHLHYSPERLNQIEDRLAEITRIKRKYGDSIELILKHLHDAEERILTIETAEFREQELKLQLEELRSDYLSRANDLHDKRVSAAAKFEAKLEQNLQKVALEKAKFQIRVEEKHDEDSFSATGYDRIEFYFSANPGESAKPLARVASGGEVSRLMLILKTTVKAAAGTPYTAVFDEIDVGIGGRVAEAVGRKLKELAATQQVLCVTHQPQIASLSDRHFVVTKAVVKGRTSIDARRLAPAEQIEEIARMLAGEEITDAARANARVMIAAGK